MAYREPEYEKHVTFFYVCVKERNVLYCRICCLITWLPLLQGIELCVFSEFACVKRESLNTWNEKQQVLFFQYKFQTNWFYYHFFPPVLLQMGVPLLQVYFIAQKSLSACNRELWKCFISLCWLSSWSVLAWCLNVCADTVHCICWRSHQCLSATSSQYRFYRLVWLEPVAQSSSRVFFFCQMFIT